MPGKIIAILGAPAVGKSTLVKKLGGLCDAKLFLEGDGGSETFPRFVQDNIRADKNALQTNLFFQNLTVRQYLKALRLAHEGRQVVLDTFWLTNRFYAIPAVYSDQNDMRLMLDLVETARQAFAPPDALVYMRATPALIGARIAERGRDFEKSSFLDKALQVGQAHEDYFSSGQAHEDFPNTTIVTIDADKHDPGGVAQQVCLS